MTGTGEVYPVRKSKALLAKMSAEIVGSLLGGSDRYNPGRLVNRRLGNSISQVQENIGGNIETFIASAVVSRYLFAAVAAAYFELKNDCKHGFC